MQVLISLAIGRWGLAEAGGWGHGLEGHISFPPAPAHHDLSSFSSTVPLRHAICAATSPLQTENVSQDKPFQAQVSGIASQQQEK